MERRDYLLRQIQEFTQVLLKITGLADDGKILEGIEVVDNFFSSKVDISLSDLELLSDDEIIKHLTEIKKYGVNEIEILAELFNKTAQCLEENMNKERALRNFLISKRLYIFVDETSDTFSMERMALIQKLEKEIKNG